MHGPLSWRERLCAAILDYRTAPKSSGGICACPAYVVWVNVRGSIRGRPVNATLTPCLCREGKRAARDTLIVLKMRPRFS